VQKITVVAQRIGNHCSSNPRRGVNVAAGTLCVTLREAYATFCT